MRGKLNHKIPLKSDQDDLLENFYLKSLKHFSHFPKYFMCINTLAHWLHVAFQSFVSFYLLLNFY